MKYLHRLGSLLMFVAALAPLGATAQAEAPRPIVVISDFHMGLGRRADGTWDPKEDFRWTGALRGFLSELSRRNSDRTDLVIAGDFLELWAAGRPTSSVPATAPTSAAPWPK